MTDDSDAARAYCLDDQVGFLMRRANQRHLAIFAYDIPDLTPTQFAALAKLHELGNTTQNALGRATAMDAATIKGVVDRLRKRGLVRGSPDPSDQRRTCLELTAAGRALFAELAPRALDVTRHTLEPLSPEERKQFLALLARLT